MTFTKFSELPRHTKIETNLYKIKKFIRDKRSGKAVGTGLTLDFNLLNVPDSVNYLVALEEHEVMIKLDSSISDKQYSELRHQVDMFYDEKDHISDDCYLGVWFSEKRFIYRSLYKC